MIPGALRAAARGPRGIVVLESLMLTLIWTFNLSALTLIQRADLLKRVVVSSWHLLVLLVAAELVWSGWALWTGQPPVVCTAALWLGVNLLVTARVARQHAHELTGRQIVLLCSWWLGLAAMLLRAVLGSAGVRS